MKLLNENIINAAEFCDTDACFIVHGVNDVNRMGSGVAKALYDRYPEVKHQYHEWWSDNESSCLFVSSDTPSLGEIQIFQVEQHRDVFVCNLVSQKGIGKIYIGSTSVPCANRDSIYEGLVRTMEYIADWKNTTNKSATMCTVPLGCGLGGLSWGKMLPVLSEISDKYPDIPVIIFDYSREHFYV